VPAMGSECCWSVHRRIANDRSRSTMVLCLITSNVRNCELRIFFLFWFGFFFFLAAKYSDKQHDCASYQNIAKLFSTAALM
jgi:hypothetical protein